MPEIDMFAYMIKKLGEPEQAQIVSKEEADSYRGRLPDALLNFWQEHGRGSYKDGTYWICDPAPYRGVIDEIFKFDPKYRPEEMTAIGYDGLGELWIWHREFYDITVTLKLSEVSNPPDSSRTDSKTGEKFSPDFSIGTYIASIRNYDPPCDDDGEPLIPQAIARLGRLNHDEIYGYVPALMLGGQNMASSLQKFSAPEHMMFLASLQPLVLTELTPPEPGHPYGRVVPVRKVGRQ
ncbi:GAD-like domain-containing protein [Allorhizobium taibaishanense]|uniref:GAD-related domain-containing protein n=1 Tax=Allorhizobium taibaishanense TaxID=887144 RepID=A0A1Q9AC18_9HYPH|nr:GAD-like domain-containing protein [Allorhizobium taibaishanense]MBB4010678.1 hypothetical protein [Allorhizobium taibaishanense]OLP52412.1 hypothetical protein BJF91_15260 [Allorhizobium taibaishanense]